MLPNEEKAKVAALCTGMDTFPWLGAIAEFCTLYLIRGDFVYSNILQ
jgi:hypothetical protein